MQEEQVLSAEDIIRAQLTLRTVVWDVSETDALTKSGELDKLNKDLKYYQILVWDIYTEQGIISIEKKAGQMLQCISDTGVSRAEALLVTDDAGLAEYMYQQTQAAVVYYEKEDGAQSVSADMIVQGFEEIGIQFLDRVHKRRNRLPWNILYTKRTCVREITLADLDALFGLYAQEGITDYTEPLLERAEEAEYIKSYIDCMYYYYGYGMWVVTDRQTGRLIGRAGIEHHDEAGCVLEELGYIIDRNYQNQGYAEEVCRAILAYASEELEMEEMYCFIHPENAPSVRVAEKLGFVRDDESGKETGGLVRFYKKL